jgi:hypothetical protein
MSARHCLRPLGLSLLLDYWMADIDPPQEQQVEEHLLACGHCSAELEQVVAMGAALRELMRGGWIHAVLPVAFLQRLALDGLRIREYRLEPGGSVDCGVHPEDALVVSRLRAPLADVSRLDVVVIEGDAAPSHRLTDVPFERAGDEIFLAPVTSVLRQREPHVQTVRLLAVEADGERLLGEYVFRHAPWSSADPAP